MNNPKISIIVPVYNVEQYLPRCLDSILAQTFTDFEVLLVDDGSKDRSGAICDEYAVKDARIRVFHKPNGGVSSARNVGLDEAYGEWVNFVDADDIVSDDCLEKLLAPADDEVDIVIGDFQPFGITFEKKALENRRYSNSQWGACLAERMKTMPFGVPWGKLFRNGIIRTNGIRFDEDIHFNEDFLFNQTYFYKMIGGGQTVASTVYHWRNTEGFKYGTGIDEYVYALEVLNGMYEKLCRKYSYQNDEYIRGVFNAHTVRLTCGKEKLKASVRSYGYLKKKVRELLSLSSRFHYAGSPKNKVMFFLIRHQLHIPIYVLLKYIL